MTPRLLVVDVQPAYAFSADCVATSVTAQINSAKSPVICWVGKGVTEDTENDVREYLWKNGATRKALGRATFVEKDYGWLRSWMDYGVDEEDILTVLSNMLKTSRRDTSEYTTAELESLLGHTGFPNDDPLYIQGNFDATELLNCPEWTVCGGGTDECLREMELWLSANGKQTTRLDSCVY